MIDRDCPVCRGNGSIRLPLYPRLQIVPDSVESAGTMTSKGFPCPECCHIPEEKVAFVRVEVRVSELELRTVNAPIRQLVRDDAARQIAAEIAEHLEFVERRNEPNQFGVEFVTFTVTAGVLSPNYVASMEARIAERQAEVAEQVRQEAIREVRNWGSFYNAWWITKDEACHLINDGFTAATRKQTVRALVGLAR